MHRGRTGRLMALVSAVALAAAAGTTGSPGDGTAAPAEVAGVVHLRDGILGSSMIGGVDNETLERIRRLRRRDAVVAAAGGEASPAAGDAVIAPPPESFEAPPAPPSPPPPRLVADRWEGVAPTGGTWALVVGINDYPGSRHDLRSAVADADDVNTALATLGVPGDQRVVLRDGQANRATILAGLDWLVAHAGRDAVAVVFYAGHVRKLRAGVEALVAADGGIITDAELAQQLARLEARRAWIGIAACYAGGFTEVAAPGRILTGAAPANSLAYENEAFGRSYMVEYMVRRAIIEHHADRSVEAAFGFAEAELRRDYPNRLPVQFDWADGELDLRPPSARPQAPAGDEVPPPDDGGSSSGSGGSGSGDGGSGGSGGDDSDDDDDGDTCSSLTIVISCRDDE